MADGSATAVCDLGRGDHACLVSECDGERWRLVSDYVRDGVDRGERIVYVTAEHSVDHVRNALNGLGERVDVLIASEQPGYGGAYADYLHGLVQWKECARRAVGDGYSGLRVAFDMTWVDAVDLSLEQLVDYERRSTHVLREMPGTALCIYDQRRFHSHTLARAGHAHRVRLGTGAARTPVFRSQLLTVSRSGPGAVALAGEIDVSNVKALATALESVVDTQEALLLDLGGLTFIDAAGLRALHDTARRLLGRGGELVLLSPPRVVEQMLPVLGLCDVMTLDRDEPAP